MSRGRTKIFARVSPTLLAAVADAAHRRGVDHSTVVRDALAAYLQPRRHPAVGQAQATSPPMPGATDLLHSLDPATRAQLTEGMSRPHARPCAEYARRAGIEGTISRETRSMRLRRTRYIGLRRVHLGHILAAVGLNVLRLGEWFLETARAKTRITPFARLMAHAPAA